MIAEKKIPLENLFASTLNSLNDLLPPLWQVIYYEGARANHILFSKRDLEKLEKESSSKPIKISEQESDIISSIAVNILKSDELKSIRLLIESLTYKQKRVLYFIYQNTLQNLQKRVRNQLN